MTSFRFTFATASRAIRLARAGVGVRALGGGSMAACHVVDVSRSPGQGPPVLR